MLVSFDLSVVAYSGITPLLVNLVQKFSVRTKRPGHAGIWSPCMFGMSSSVFRVHVLHSGPMSVVFLCSILQVIFTFLRVV